MGAARAGRRSQARRALVVGVVVALATGFAVTADLVRPSPPTAEAAIVLARVANGVGKCLDNAGNATTVNNRVQGNPCSTAPAQQWSRQGLTIRTPGNRCLEPLAGRTAVKGLYHDKSIPGGTIHMAGQKLGTGYAAADPAR